MMDTQMAPCPVCGSLLAKALAEAIVDPHCLEKCPTKSAKDG